MAKISKRILDKELEEYILELFSSSIIDLKTKDDVNNFLKDLLSPTEIIMIVKRLAIAILLSKGHTYEVIDEKLKVSRGTIMNVSFWLKNGHSGYQNVIQKIIKDQKREDLIDRIEEFLLRISPPKAYGSVGYERKRDQGKKLFKRKLLRERV